jgi:iron complex outermembrane recepter protein
MGKGHKRRDAFLRGAASCAVLAVLIPAAPANAQGDEEPERVIVQGTRIPRALEDTHASVGVLTELSIIEKDIQNIREAFRLFANVIDSDWVDAGFVLRGVNSEGLTPGGAPLATIYVDGAAQTIQGARRGLRGLWDVSQVELYRGPQSTLSGRASLAGAIYIKTNDPTFDWQMAGQATYGEHATAGGALMLGGPIVANRLAFRVAAEYQRSETDLNYPLYEQYSRFNEFAEDEYYQIRGKLLFTPTVLNGGRALLTYAFAHDSPLYDDIAGPGLGFDYSERRGDLNAGTPFFQANRETDNHSAVFDVTTPFSDMLMFTSTTTYAFTRLDRSSINKGTPGEVYVADGFEDQSYVTQEFRLNFNSDRLQWVAGLYGAYQSAKVDQTTTNFFSGGRLDMSRPSSNSRNIAAFGEATYEFVPTWKATLGARADYETQEQNFFFSRDFTNPAFTDILRQGTSENDGFTFLPKAGIVKQLGPAQSLGFTVQRGYRSGGAGVDANDGSAYEFKPEYTWNYELSYRSSYFDGRMSLGANVFYTDWTDQQVEIQLVPQDFTSTVILNAGSSHLYGGEIESQIRITPELSTFVAIGYVETQFDEFVSSVGDFGGMPFPEAPKWTVSFGGDYNHASGFFIGADARHVSGYLARDLQNAPVDKVGDYFIANLRVGYRAERWSVTVFSDNIFDEEYFLYRDVIGTFDCCGTLGPRRVTGVTLRVTN